MKTLVLIILLCNTSIVFAYDLETHCKNNLKGKYTKKRKKNICWCVGDNLQAQLNLKEQEWLKEKSGADLSEVTKKRIKDVEFTAFKNCTSNYKWKVNRDDLGVPDDISTP